MGQRMNNKQSTLIISANIVLAMYIFISAYFLFDRIAGIFKSDVVEEVRSSVFSLTIITAHGKQRILNNPAILSLTAFLINMASFVYAEIKQRHKKQED